MGGSWGTCAGNSQPVRWFWEVRLWLLGVEGFIGVGGFRLRDVCRNPKLVRWFLGSEVSANEGGGLMARTAVAACSGHRLVVGVEQPR